MKKNMTNQKDEHTIKKQIELLRTKKDLLVLKRMTTPSEIQKNLTTLTLTLSLSNLLEMLNKDGNLKLLNYIPLGFWMINIYKNFNYMKSEYTDDYFEALELYKGYIKSLSDVFKTYNIKSTMTASQVFTYFLHKGFFNANSMRFLQSSPYDIKEKGFQELYGSKTLGKITPNTNHCSSMLADLLNEMNYNACTLICKQDHSFFHEAFTGIVDNNQKFAYDLNNSEFLFFDSKYKLHSINKDLTVNEHYEIFDKYNRENNNNILRSKQYKLIKKAQKKQLDIKELKDSLEESEQKIEEMIPIMKEFRATNKTRVKKICDLNHSFNN